MKRPIVVSGLVALLSLIAFGRASVLAQNVPQSVFGAWQDVMAIQPGEKLEIKLKNGKGLKGTVDAVTDTGISASRDGKIVRAERGDIKQVYRVTQKRSNRPVILGAVIGAVVGVGATAAAIMPWRMCSAVSAVAATWSAVAWAVDEIQRVRGSECMVD